MILVEMCPKIVIKLSQLEHWSIKIINKLREGAVENEVQQSKTVAQNPGFNRIYNFARASVTSLIKRMKYYLPITDFLSTFHETTKLLSQHIAISLCFPVWNWNVGKFPKYTRKHRIVPMKDYLLFAFVWKYLENRYESQLSTEGYQWI